MNNRKRKKLAARRRTGYGRREGFHRLLDLVLDINGVKPRDCEVTGQLPTAFFDFSGHTAAAHIRVYSNGWGGDCYADYTNDVWEHQNVNVAAKRLEELRNDLQVNNHEPA